MTGVLSAGLLVSVEERKYLGGWKSHAKLTTSSHTRHGLRRLPTSSISLSTPLAQCNNVILPLPQYNSPSNACFSKRRDCAF
jgi:hypothetical protein